MKTQTSFLVAILAVAAGMLPTFSHGATTNISLINISQGNAAIQICGSGCVQVLQQNNIAIVAVNQGGLDFLGSAYLSPGAYDFGKVVHAKAKAITLSNTSGTQPLVVPPAAIGFSGANPGDFSQTNNCPIVLWPGQRCAIQVVFAPSVVGPRSAVLAVRDSAIDSPEKVDVSGTGVAAEVTPSSIDFGTQQVGTQGPGASVTIHNPGTDALAVTGAGLSGGAAGDFAAGGCGSVPADGSCALKVTFKPSDGGVRQAVLGVSVAGLGGPFAVSLSGVGAPLSLSPSSLDFGSVLVGTRTPARGVALTNLGSSPLTVTGIGVSGGGAGDFTATGCGPLPVTLAGGATCAAGVVFAPSATGVIGSSLAVRYTAAGMPFSATAPVAGTGIAPGFAFDTTGLSFGSVVLGQSASKPLTVSNPGTAPLTISAMTVTGGGAHDYALSSACGSLPVTLAPGASCLVGVTFTPAAAADRGATLKVSDNAAGAPQLLALTGSGVRAAPAATSGGTGGGSGGVSGRAATGGATNAASSSSTGAVAAASAPGLPNSGAAGGSTGPRMVGFASPLVGAVEVAWLGGVTLVALLAVVSGVRRRRRTGLS